jgi:hypothetical protein
MLHKHSRTKSTTNLQDLRNETEIAIAENDKLQFNINLQAERQRQIRDDVTASIQDRTKANNKLGEVLQEQGRLQEENAQKLVDLRKLELQKIQNQLKQKSHLLKRKRIF